MKTLIALATLFAPLAANATTNLTCQGPRRVTFHLLADGNGIATQGAIVTIVANGVLHTVIDAVVDGVDTSHPNKVIVAVTTIDKDGQTSPDSGKARIELGDRNGVIHVDKNPPNFPSNLIPLKDYVLRDCIGTL
jgi:hypothetical protein